MDKYKNNVWIHMTTVEIPGTYIVNRTYGFSTAEV
jgi:hypothetical protein